MVSKTIKIASILVALSFVATAAVAPIFSMTSGDMRTQAIDDYFEQLGTMYDPDNAIVSNTDQTTMKGYTFEDGSTTATTTQYITRSVGDSNGSTGICNVSTKNMKVYPGALLRADSKLADGVPTTLDFGANRGKILLQCDLVGNDEYTVDPVITTPSNYTAVESAVGEMLNQWSKNDPLMKENTTVETTKNTTQKQASIALGIDLDIFDSLGITVSYDYTTDYTIYTVKYTQIYYTVSAKQVTEDIFRPSNYFGKDVTADMVKEVFDDKPGVFVSSATYGKMVVATFTSDSTTSDIGLVIDAVINGTTASLPVDLQKVASELDISATVIGGCANASKGILKTIDEINSVVFQTPTVEDYKCGALISAETTFVDSNEIAYVVQTDEYTEKVVTVVNSISVSFKSNALFCAYVRIYCDTYDSIDSNGNYVNYRSDSLVFDTGCTSYGNNMSGTITAKHAGSFHICYEAVGNSTWPLNMYTFTTPQSSIEMDIAGACWAPEYYLYVDGTLIKQQS